jgi:hypothetical protein
LHFLELPDYSEKKGSRILSKNHKMDKINFLLFLLKEQLKDEKDERNLRIKELLNDTQYDLFNPKPNKNLDLLLQPSWHLKKYHLGFKL